MLQRISFGSWLFLPFTVSEVTHRVSVGVQCLGDRFPIIEIVACFDLGSDSSPQLSMSESEICLPLLDQLFDKPDRGRMPLTSMDLLINDFLQQR